MLTRREYLKLSAAAGLALAINPRLLLAQDAPQALITRTIPGTSEQLPVVGLGSSASFARIAGEGELDRVRAVLEALLQHGGRVFDTAPGYGVAEDVAGGVVRDAGLGERLFWATKLNVAGRGGDAADPLRRAHSSSSRSRASASHRSTWCRCTTWATCRPS